ncbi:hypothetical protein [Pseudonocardia xishanensis]|uniref:Acyl-CoA dehydrogenase-like protein n=1 Tax=Pseudonocardia xishanensis TaxID=630995 RepID=A0ABP8RXV1_9PSEU
MELTFALARLALVIAERSHSRPWARAAYMAAAQLVQGVSLAVPMTHQGGRENEREREVRLP